MTYFFERNFDAEGAGVAPVADGDAQPATVDAEEQARSQGYDDGYQQGLLDGRAELDGAQAQVENTALSQLAASCETLFREAETHRLALEQDMAEFALRACEKVLPELVRTRSADQVKDVVRRHASIAMGSPKLSIALSEAAHQAHGAALEAALKASASSTDIEISVDCELAEGDARMAWKNGSLIYSYDRLCTSILEAVRNMHIAPDEAETERMPEDV